MLSKQEKLKYGEMLRLQKQQRDRLEQIERGLVKKSLNHYQNNIINQKQLLQRKFQKQQYQPFGKPGAGAPIIKRIQKQQNNNLNYISNNQSYQIPIQHHQQKYSLEGLPQQQSRNNSKKPQYFQKRYPSYQEHPYNYRYGMQSYNYPPQPYYMNHPNNNFQNYGYHNQPPPQNFNFIHKQRYPHLISEFNNNNLNPQKLNNENNYNIKHKNNIQNLDISKQIRVQNESIQQVFRKGGRNLLQLQNQLPQQFINKQKIKNQMSNYLKTQIQQAGRKKQQEKRKLRQIQQRQEQLNNQYIEKQKQKIIDDQRKQIEKRQKIIKQNQQNLQLKLKLQENNKLAAQQRKKQITQPSIAKKQKTQLKKRKKIVEEESSSFTSSHYQSSFSNGKKSFHTTKQKQIKPLKTKKKEYQRVDDKQIYQFKKQLQKMKDQISNQGIVFQKQLLKVKIQSQRVKNQERIAKDHILILKQQLNKKAEEDNRKLLQALKRNTRQNTNQASKIYQHQQRNQLIKKRNQTAQRFQSSRQLQNDNQQKILSSKSKKIPISLPYIVYNKKISMSQLSQYAQQTSFFKNKFKIPKKNQNKFYNQSILQQSNVSQYQQQKIKNKLKFKDQIHQNHYYQDQIDKIIDTKQQWDKMNKDYQNITNQIQQLLKKKIQKMNQLPISPFSGNSNQKNYQNNYEINQLDSNKNIDTLDIDKINLKNDQRLKKLKTNQVYQSDISNAYSKRSYLH